MVMTDDDAVMTDDAPARRAQRGEGRWIVGIDGSPCATNALR
jgi:hypothetical protein